MSGKNRIMVVIFLIIISCLTPLCIFANNENNNKNNVPKESKITLENITGFTHEGKSNITTIKINITNITRINFTLTWMDYSYDPLVYGLGELDEFELEVQGPNNSSFDYSKKMLLDNENRTGFIFIEAISDESKAGYSNNNFLGIWHINVTCLNATGYTTWCNCPSIEKVEDFGNPWVLITAVYFFRN